MSIIAFDVDGTLTYETENKDRNGTPNYENIEILWWFFARGHEIRIWSAGGVEYAETVARRLGLLGHPRINVVAKGSERVDISFDDQEVDLGKVNIKV